jgi:hypothetical protein
VFCSPQHALGNAAMPEGTKTRLAVPIAARLR